MCIGGGGSSDPVVIEPAPAAAPLLTPVARSEYEAGSRDPKRRRAKMAQASSKTILTSSEGDISSMNSGKKTLLGE